MSPVRAGFVDGRAVTGALVMFLIVGVLIGGVVFSPLYFLGRYHGREAVIREAIERGHYVEQFDPNTGERIRKWR